MECHIIYEGGKNEKGGEATMELIPIKKETLKSKGIPFSPATLYRWHCKKKYQKLFVKIGGKLFLKLEEWEKLINKVNN
jgi:hypothetical protein